MCMGREGGIYIYIYVFMCEWNIVYVEGGLYVMDECMNSLHVYGGSLIALRVVRVQ